MGQPIEFGNNEVKVKGYFASPAGGSGPGVLVMHAWWGLNDFFKSVVDRLAKEGFVALAPDLYDGELAGTIVDAERLINELDYREAIKVEVAALDFLLSYTGTEGGQVGAIGFSMGAAYASWLATLRPEVCAVVMVYGGGEQEEGFAERASAAFQGHFAEGDEWEPDESVRKTEAQLKAAGRDVEFYYYSGVGHWFMEENRKDAYNPEAAQLAWQRILDFLHRHLSYNIPNPS